MLRWSAAYKTGIELIDAQHQMLFHHVNRLAWLANQPKVDPLEVMPLISFLDAYVENHFDYEEACMLRFRCPAHAANRKAHREFLDRWNKFKKRYDKVGPERELLQELNTATQTWLDQHICKVDIKLREFAKTGGA
jgi:hemerythrin